MRENRGSASAGGNATPKSFVPALKQALTLAFKPKRRAFADDVPVHTRWWCTFIMIPLAVFTCLVQASAIGIRFLPKGTGPISAIQLLAAVFTLFALLLAFVIPFSLLRRSTQPEMVFWLCFVTVLVFPFDPLLLLMALTAHVARRRNKAVTLLVCGVSLPVVVLAHMRDALQPPQNSMWHSVFAGNANSTVSNAVDTTQMLVSNATIIVIAIIYAFASWGVAVLIGFYIRTRAGLALASKKVQAEQHRSDDLQQTLHNQKLADAIAAEAHDTLAHSLSLISLNASVLQAQMGQLEQDRTLSPQQTQQMLITARTLREQAAGAMDETHSIIDMLRHPDLAWEQLSVPSTEVCLTRESLQQLLNNVREAGVQVNTWIEIEELSGLRDSISKVAYRGLQESLTNAMRHAPGAEIMAEITATPKAGVHIHVSNSAASISLEGSSKSAGNIDSGITSAETANAAQQNDQENTPQAEQNPTPPGGTGLIGLTRRVEAEGGQLQFGFDDRHLFHVDATIPWA
ncbi:histidine kinase [Gleimia hominis]|uniref:histidine kinase n=1 Tax=Gleimia hominis TaxID=595468 RepID=A0ABU3IA82_9ACTO|nr:histidine kinase [Gleimia hominis]MDT3767278.1 histidine kinase [Gleimia hominis]